MGPAGIQEEQIDFGSCADKKNNRINHSALFSYTQRRVITCGTHFEETKLVASITGRPVSESMSISWILTPVGTISWGTMNTETDFSGFDSCQDGRYSRQISGCQHSDIHIDMLTREPVEPFEISKLIKALHKEVSNTMYPVQSVHLLECNKE